MKPPVNEYIKSVFKIWIIRHSVYEDFVKRPASMTECTNAVACKYRVCTFAPGSENCAERTFAPVELSFRGTGFLIQLGTPATKCYYGACRRGQ